MRCGLAFCGRQTTEIRSSDQELDGLSDEEIESLYHRTLKQVALSESGTPA